MDRFVYTFKLNDINLLQYVVDFVAFLFVLSQETLSAVSHVQHRTGEATSQEGMRRRNGVPSLCRSIRSSGLVEVWV